MSLLDKVKAHPYITAGIGLAAVGAVILVAGSGGTTSVALVPNTGDATSAGSDMQSMQLQAQTYLAGLNAQSQDNAMMAGSAVQLANLKYQSEYDIASLGAAVATAQLNSQQQTTMQYNTLAATIAGQQIDAANRGTQAQVDMNANMLAVMKQQISSAADVSKASINAQLEASKPHGLFSFLFG